MDLIGRKVFRLHIHAGVDLIGSKTSMQASKKVEMTMTGQGVLMISKTTNREIVIPYANSKGIELFPVEQSEIQSESSSPRRGRPPKVL